MRSTATASGPSTAPAISADRSALRASLLVCGILASLLYVFMNVVASMRWESYSSVSQTVSELSAIGAPSRRLWVSLGVVYSLLGLAFGVGVWSSARKSRALRVVGAAMIVDALLGFVWPPMHLREVLAAGGATLTDTLHIVFTAVTSALMLVAMGFGAAALGRRFRIYSIVTIVVLLAFGTLTSMEAPNIDANLPTPFIGVWERIDIASYMLWVVVFAVALLRRRDRSRLRRAG